MFACIKVSEVGDENVWRPLIPLNLNDFNSMKIKSSLFYSTIACFFLFKRAFKILFWWLLHDLLRYSWINFLSNIFEGDEIEIFFFYLFIQIILWWYFSLKWRRHTFNESLHKALQLLFKPTWQVCHCITQKWTVECKSFKQSFVEFALAELENFPIRLQCLLSIHFLSKEIIWKRNWNVPHGWKCSA